MVKKHLIGLSKAQDMPRLEYFQPLPAFDPHVSQILGSFWQILSAKSGSVLSACEQVDDETGVDMQRSACDVLLIIGLL